jgi:hypothetical protein
MQPKKSQPMRFVQSAKSVVPTAAVGFSRQLGRWPDGLLFSLLFPRGERPGTRWELKTPCSEPGQQPDHRTPSPAAIWMAGAPKAQRPDSPTATPCKGKTGPGLHFNDFPEHPKGYVPMGIAASFDHNPMITSEEAGIYRTKSPQILGSWQSQPTHSFLGTLFAAFLERRGSILKALLVASTDASEGSRDWRDSGCRSSAAPWLCTGAYFRRTTLNPVKTR